MAGYFCEMVGRVDGVSAPCGTGGDDERLVVSAVIVTGLNGELRPIAISSTAMQGW